VAYPAFIRGGARKDRDPNATRVIASGKHFLTLYAQFHYLLTLNEALLQHFLLIFITKKTDSVYKIRNTIFSLSKEMPWPGGISFEYATENYANVCPRPHNKYFLHVAVNFDPRL